MEETNSMLAILIVGFVCLMIGFSRRDNEWGVAILAVGAVIMLGTIAYRIYSGLQI